MGLLLAIDIDSRTPKYRQVIQGIVKLIEAGALPPGERLPASRTLARNLGLNRSTVYRAYQELWSMGYVDSRPGSYSVVRARPPVAHGPTAPGRGGIDWAAIASPAAQALTDARRSERTRLARAAAPEVISFLPLSPDPRLFPLDDFRRSMNRVLADSGRELLGYGSPRGYRPLREYIARRMVLHGIRATPGEVMLTTGAQNALDLLFKLLARPGRRVIMEGPTYSRALDLARSCGAEVVAAPMTGRGMDLDALEGMIGRIGPRMVYTIPNFHNPTGLTTDQAHRERLLAICRSHGLPLVEDGFEEEMKYFGKAVLPIKSMDHHGVVIYIGTFSKVLFPGLRIGWITADRDCLDRLTALQQASILSGNILDQAAVADFCDQGLYDLHLRRLHRVYRRRMTCALAALERELAGTDVAWTTPAGGYTIWLRPGQPCPPEERVVDHLLDRGVAVMPGTPHFPGQGRGPAFRLSIAHLDRAAIEEGVARLARALKEF